MHWTSKYYKITTLICWFCKTAMYRKCSAKVCLQCHKNKLEFLIWFDHFCVGFFKLASKFWFVDLKFCKDYFSKMCLKCVKYKRHRWKMNSKHICRHCCWLQAFLNKANRKKYNVRQKRHFGRSRSVPPNRWVAKPFQIGRETFLIVPKLRKYYASV